MGGKRKKRRQKSVGSVAADPDSLENSKEARREAQVTLGVSKNCTSRESVSPLSRLIKGFVISIIDPPGRICYFFSRFNFLLMFVLFVLLALVSFVLLCLVTRRRHFQHAHSIIIVGMGKRGAY